MRLLSEALRNQKKLDDIYAVCYGCKETFFDDVPEHPSLVCPNGCGNVLYRLRGRDAGEEVKL